MQDWIFEQNEHGVTLSKVCGSPIHAIIPDTYCGKPVSAIGAYAFAQQKQLKSITLPASIQSIEKHAFYNCRQLEELNLYHGIASIGDGAFKNCEALHRITMDGMQHIQYILSDCMQEITLTMTLEQTQTAVLLFPEYDYEYLENVPPREFRSITYGSGSFYRRCISDAGVNFTEYDKTFERAVREDLPDTVQTIAFYRLQFPYHLQQKYQQRYLEYIAHNISRITETTVRQANIPWLELLLTYELMDQETLSGAITLAAQLDKPEVVSLLMEHRINRFGQQHRQFIL